MSRAVIVINGDVDRRRAASWATQAPFGTRITFREAKRTTDQNAKMWASLTEVARQKEHCGRRYSADIWKCLFMHALGKEMQFVEALDGSTTVPLGFSSSELSKQEMSDLIEIILKWGAENGVTFNDPQAAA